MVTCACEIESEENNLSSFNDVIHSTCGMQAAILLP